jgi:hypothetical protein
MHIISIYSYSSFTPIRLSTPHCLSCISCLGSHFFTVRRFFLDTSSFVFVQLSSFAYSCHTSILHFPSFGFPVFTPFIADLFSLTFTTPTIHALLLYALTLPTRRIYSHVITHKYCTFSLDSVHAFMFPFFYRPAIRRRNANPCVMMSK